MYDELTKWLREIASLPEHCENVADCDKCTKEEICRSFTNKQIFEMATQAADAIEELTKPRWIPVTEWLPLRGDAVLCVGDNGIGIADFVCGDKWCAIPWFYVDGERETNVTHWMPLPEPPKEE